MMKLRLLAAATATIAVMGAASVASASTYTFVGSWFVSDGTYWVENPAVLNALQTAALLFGGNASDYVISTLGEDVSLINFRAHVDGWADDQYLDNDTVAQDFSLDTGGAGYNSNPGTGSAYSAYVLDHGEPGVSGQNFAFRISDAVPEPATWGLMIMGFGVTGAAMRSRRRTAVAA